LQKFGSQQLKTDRCFKILKTDTEVNGFFGSVFSGTEQHRTILKQALACCFCCACACLIVLPHLPRSCHWLGQSLLAAAMRYCLLVLPLPAHGTWCAAARPWALCLLRSCRWPARGTPPARPPAAAGLPGQPPHASGPAARSRSHALISVLVRCVAGLRSSLFGSSADSVRWKPKTEAEADNRNSQKSKPTPNQTENRHFGSVRLRFGSVIGFR